MSGRPGSNRRHSAWKADALPTELLPHGSKYIIFFYFGGVKYTIQEVLAKDTISIRHQMLRQGLPVSSCHFEKDNDPQSHHWAALIGYQMVGILSSMENECDEFLGQHAYQFRGMAVLETFQRQGIASRLLVEAEEQLQKKYQPDLFWLNARVHAQKLYQILGYSPVGKEFNIPTAGPHIRFYKSNS